MSRSPENTPEGLLEHLDWVHRLARRLTADSGLAEDAAQEAAMALSLQPPGKGVNVRAWLGGVLKNRIRQGRRAAGRRSHHEAASARAEVQPSALDLVARASVQRQVVDTVLGLREPYRTVVLLRYFEGLTPGKIAAREGLPVETVKTRLKRGLALLREQLDAEHGGDGKTWAMVLMTHLPIQRGVLAGAAAGVSIVTLKHFIAPSLAAVAALAAGWWLLADENGAQLSRDDGAAVATYEPELEEAVETGVEIDRTEIERVESSAFTPAVLGATKTPDPDRLLAVEGRVITTDSALIADVAVQFVATGSSPETAVEVGRTDGAGRLELELEPSSGFLTVETESWTTVLPGAVQAVGDVSRPTVVVAPPRTVEGRVVDAEGRPMADAEVRYTSSDFLWGRLDFKIDRVGPVEFETRSDSAGYFVFERAPELLEARLFASAGAVASGSVDVPERGSVYLEVVVGEPPSDSDVLLGRVVDAADRPVAGAWVSLGGQSQRTADDGRFVVQGGGDLAGDVLRAAAPGYLPAELPAAEDGTWPEELILRLGREALELSGRVLDAEGEPAVGVQVRLLGSTTFGLLNFGNEQDPAWMMASVESVTSGIQGGLDVRTDEQGRFEFAGLLDRSYGLLAVDRGALSTVHLEAVQAGSSDVELRFVEGGETTRVAGRVVGANGEPIPRASVTLIRFGTPAEVGAASLELRSEGLTTDDLGAFEFDVLVGDDARLHIYAGPAYPMRTIPLADEPDLADIEVEVRGLASFYVDLGGSPELANRAELLDAEGAPTSLYQTQGLGMFSMQEIFMKDGRSPVMSAPEGTWELVLWSGDTIVERREIVLVPGDPQAITF